MYHSIRILSKSSVKNLVLPLWSDFRFVWSDSETSMMQLLILITRRHRKRILFHNNRCNQQYRPMKWEGLQLWVQPLKKSTPWHEKVFSQCHYTITAAINSEDPWSEKDYNYGSSNMSTHEKVFSHYRKWSCHRLMWPKYSLSRSPVLQTL